MIMLLSHIEGCRSDRCWSAERFQCALAADRRRELLFFCLFDFVSFFLIVVGLKARNARGRVAETCPTVRISTATTASYRSGRTCPPDEPPRPTQRADRHSSSSFGVIILPLVIMRQAGIVGFSVRVSHVLFEELNIRLLIFSCNSITGLDWVLLGWLVDRRRGRV